MTTTLWQQSPPVWWVPATLRVSLHGIVHEVALEITETVTAYTLPRAGPWAVLLDADADTFTAVAYDGLSCFFSLRFPP